jgi:hypothetical protein
MPKILISLILALMLVVAVPFGASTANDGIIEGSLVNSTAGSVNSVAGLSVILQIYQGSSAGSEKTALSDQEGKYFFDGLKTEADYVYVIKVVFQDVDYYSEPIAFEAGETLKTSQVKVYDTTSSDKSIFIDMAHVIISASTDVLNIRENYLIMNNSDLTYIGSNSSGKRDTLKFNVPRYATSVTGSVGLDQSLITVQNGSFFSDSVVTPDGTFVSYTYKLAFTEDQKILSWQTNYDMGRFDLLIENPNVRVSGDRLTPESPLTISGKTYDHYSILDLKKGDTLDIHFSGLLPDTQKGSFNWAWLSLIPVAGVIITLIVLRKKKSRSKSTSEIIPASGLKDQLLSEIAALDDSYAEGNINHAEYLKLRHEKKQKLMDLTKEKDIGD